MLVPLLDPAVWQWSVVTATSTVALLLLLRRIGLLLLLRIGLLAGVGRLLLLSSIPAATTAAAVRRWAVAAATGCAC